MSRATAAADLDPNCAEHAFWVRGAKHGQPCGQPISPGRGRAGRDPTHTWKCRNKQERIGQARAVAVRTADRIREPAQLPAGTARPASPATVSPVDGVGGKGGMMAPSTGGTAGSEAGDVDLERHIELGRGVPGENAAKAGSEGSSDDDGQRPLPRFGIEGEQAADLVGVVGY